MCSAVSQPLEKRIQDEKSAFSTLLTVDDDGSADFSNISAALVAASNGDTIFVYPGIYEEHSLVIDKSISLVGSGPGQTVLVGENRENLAKAREDILRTFGGIRLEGTVSVGN